MNNKKSQLRWNLQSKTTVYKRYLRGASFPSREIYQQIKMNVLLIGGSHDTITPPSGMNVIRNHLLGLDPEDTQWESLSKADNVRVPSPYVIQNVGHLPMLVRPELVNPVISEFLIHNCGLNTLSGAWQILHKTKGENKWDLKNYEKVTRKRF
jgi:pimeloyl-ACP methyl ester carboxylesterase